MEKEKEIKKPCCPNCQSENVVEKGIVKNNGIIGPDYFSWVEDPYYSCRDCGTRFDIV